MTMNCRVNSLLSSKRCGEELAYKLLCFNVSIQSSTFNAQNCNTTKSSLPDKLAQNITKKNGWRFHPVFFMRHPKMRINIGGWKHDLRHKIYLNKLLYVNTAMQKLHRTKSLYRRQHYKK